MHPRKPIKGHGGLITNWRWSIKFRGPPWQIIKGLLSPAARDREKTEYSVQELITIIAESLPEKIELSVFPAKFVPVIDPWLERLRSWGSSWGHLGWWTLYINSRSLKSFWLEEEACSFLIRACMSPLLKNYSVITASQGNINTPQHLAVSSPFRFQAGEVLGRWKEARNYDPQGTSQQTPSGSAGLSQYTRKGAGRILLRLHPDGPVSKTVEHEIG